MLQNKEAGFVGVLLLSIVGVMLAGSALYLFNKNSDHLLSNSSNSQLSLVVRSVNEDEPVTEPEKIVVNPNNDGLALFIDKNSNTNLVTTTKKEKLAVSNGNDDTVVPEKQIQVTTVEPEIVSEPILIVEPGTQPKNSLLLADARRVPFTTVELTAKGGDITIRSLTLEKRGLASDKIFVEVGFIDMGTERALNSNHQYTMNDEFTIPNGETQEIVLYGNIKDSDTLQDYDGQVASLALVKINTEAKISGSLPILGASHTVNPNLTIGSLEYGTSGLDPAISKNIYINSKNVTFSAIKMTAGGAEPLLLKFFGWTQNGSVSPNDLENVKICIVQKSDTNCYDTILDSDNKYYYSEFDNEVKIEKGESAEMYIKGDVLPGGVNRTVDFDITTSYDSMAYGITYKNYIYPYGGELDGAQPEGSFSTTEYPFYNGYAHHIVGGSANYIGR